MRIIISPAKKMVVDSDSLDVLSLPHFLPQAERLKSIMQSMARAELQALWQCNSAIAERSFKHLWETDLAKNLTPAVLAYEGLQYRHMAPGVLESGGLEFIGEHLRILSGFYALLRPFDGVVPYRLEMQAKLAPDGHADLYSYWGDKLARELCRGAGFILNLASGEYSRAVTPHLPRGVRFVTCTFGELKDGRIIQKGTLCKMARGRMVRWLAENGVTHCEGIKQFADGYTYSPAHSTVNNLVFLRADVHINT